MISRATGTFLPNAAKCGILRSVSHAVMIILALSAIGCSQAPPNFLTPPFENREHGRFSAEGIDLGPGYQIGVGDQMKIAVLRFDEFNGDVTVDSQGNIRVPFLTDRLFVKGLTIMEAEKAIGGVIRPYLQRDPRIVISLTKPDSNFFYVMGAVRKPGKFPIGDEHIFVREAIARAGWPNEYAALKRSMLVSSKPDRHVMRKIDVDDIIYKGNLTENYEMEPGDVVWIPYSYLYKVVWHMEQIFRPFQSLSRFQGLAYDMQGSDKAFDPGAIISK